MKWRTKDGAEIEISDLGDSHLENIVRILIRSVGVARVRLGHVIDRYLDGDPPEHATYAAEQARDNVLYRDSDLTVLEAFSSWNALRREVEARKLPVLADILQLEQDRISDEEQI